MTDIIYNGETGSGAKYTKKLADDAAALKAKLDALKPKVEGPPKDTSGALLQGGNCRKIGTESKRPACAAGLCCGGALATGGDVTKQLEVCQTAVATTYLSGGDVLQFACIEMAQNLKISAYIFVMTAYLLSSM